MPAPDLYTLFAYEEAIEPVWKSILTAAPFSLNAQVQFSDGDRAYPLTEVQLRNATPTGQKFIYQGRALPNTWKGTLVFRHSTVRGKNSNLQGSMLGKTRSATQQCFSLVTSSNLPYHAIDRMSESGLHRGVDADNRLDVSELSFEIVFNIRENAWPA